MYYHEAWSQMNTILFTRLFFGYRWGKSLSCKRSDSGCQQGGARNCYLQFGFGNGAVIGFFSGICLRFGLSLVLFCSIGVICMICV